MDGLNMSRRIRRTPYTDRVEHLGVTGFSVVNHMLLPKAYTTSVEEDYWHLRKAVQIWDVACQRQVQIEGEDAQKLVQLMTPRKIAKAKIGDCMYIPIIDDKAGIINDPVMLKLSETCYWLSIADSDVLLYALGLALGRNLNVKISEPDVSPLAVQGPKAEALMVKIFGEHVRKIGFFKFGWIEFRGTKQLVARSGYSRQGGFEIYLNGSHLGGAIWDHIWKAGREFDIKPGCPNLIERIEGGLLSYGNEMTRDNNPFEVGMEKFCCLDDDVNYIGRTALTRIAESGVKQKIRGVLFDGGPCPTCSNPWTIKARDKPIGIITSAIWSPRLTANVAQAMIEIEFCNVGQELNIELNDNDRRSGKVVELPFN